MRPICSKETPMPVGTPKYEWSHDDAKVTGEEYNGLAGGGDYDILTCPHCGSIFYQELPD